MRSSIVLLVPEADPIVRAVRLAHDPVAALGVDAHVTLLFPFVPAAQLDAAIVDRLRVELPHTAGITGGVELRFDRIARFPGAPGASGVSYLALADPAPVITAVRALAAAWPAYPPYGGAFPDVIPHLTLGHGDDAALAAVEAAVAPALPIIARVDAATLLVEAADGRWSPHTRFALGLG